MTYIRRRFTLYQPRECAVVDPLAQHPCTEDVRAEFALRVRWTLP